MNSPLRITMPSDLLIVGSSRSGKSLLASMFDPDVHYFGSDIWNRTNPHDRNGYLEDRQVNMINDRLMRRQRKLYVVTQFLPRSISKLTRQAHPWMPEWVWSWQAPSQMQASRSEGAKIKAITSRRPFVLNDPRFCYTLPAWMPFLQGCKFVCVFRNPHTTATEIEKSLRETRPRDAANITHRDITDSWASMYTNVLRLIDSDPDPWAVLSFQDLFLPQALDSLGRFVGARLSAAALDTNHANPTDRAPQPRNLVEIFANLCRHRDAFLNRHHH
jgi:hypothetical protein